MAVVVPADVCLTSNLCCGWSKVNPLWPLSFPALASMHSLFLDSVLFWLRGPTLTLVHIGAWRPSQSEEHICWFSLQPSC